MSCIPLSVDGSASLSVARLTIVLWRQLGLKMDQSLAVCSSAVLPFCLGKFEVPQNLGAKRCVLSNSSSF